MRTCCASGCASRRPTFVSDRALAPRLSAAPRPLRSGTVNFFLDEIAAGTPLRLALAQAQERGLNETDPVDELSGRDAALKLRIMARALVGEQERDIAISVEALDDKLLRRFIARGERWVQLSTLSDIDGVITGSVCFKPARRIANVIVPNEKRNPVASKTPRPCLDGKRTERWRLGNDRSCDRGPL